MIPLRFLLLTGAASLVLGGCATSETAKSGASSASNAQAVARPDDSLARVQKAGVLTWGADVVGGVPYVYEDPKNPGQYIGFEKEIAEEVARSLGVQLKLVVKAWDTLIPELQRGAFDMAMNGIEDTEDRALIVQFSEPYYVYSQQLTMRKESKQVASLDDLKGMKVATLSGTAAEDILRQHPEIQTVVNPEVIYSYRDLADGKVDAVLLDKPIAVAYGSSNPRLHNVGESFQEGRYVIVFRKEEASLREAVNAAIEGMKRDGKLKAIYEKYGILDTHQTKIGIAL